MKAVISLVGALILTALGALFPSTLGAFLGPAHGLVRASARIELFGSTVNALNLTEWNWSFMAVNVLVIWGPLYLIARLWRRSGRQVGVEGAAQPAGAANSLLGFASELAADPPPVRRHDGSAMRRGSRPLIAIAAILSAGAWSRAPEPQPLEVSAAYISYGDLDGSWKLTLKDPGKAMLLSYKRIKDGEQPVVVSQARLSALRDVIEKEQFFGLRDHYGDKPIDGPERRMEIKQHGRVKKVTVFSVGHNLSKREAAEVDRAMKVWLAVRDCFHDPDASP